ncbi:MAG TPA: hypothetical protein VM452_15410 [Caulifigura sp.]|jgi:hypothetical protein|nr:hypothetical protein [Caulifigura sp.]
MRRRRKQRLLEWTIPLAALAVIAVVTFIIRSSPARAPADSSSPAFDTAAARIAWMKRQFVVTPPSEFRDAHFKVQTVTHPHTHMGPPETMHWFMAKVEIAPEDAPAWAAATRPFGNPRWTRESHPLQHPTARWALSATDFDGAAFYEPEPLLGTSRYFGYQAGRMLITADGTAVYLWQHWR